MLVKCKGLRNVVLLVAKAKTGRVFDNTQIAILNSYTLKELGHDQPPTPIKTDNSTTTGFFNNSIDQKAIEILGHEISLAARPSNSRSIQNILG